MRCIDVVISTISVFVTLLCHFVGIKGIVITRFYITSPLSACFLIIFVAPRAAVSRCRITLFFTFILHNLYQQQGGHKTEHG